MTDITLPDKFAFEGALYIGNEQKISSLTLSYGLRYSFYSYYGPGDRYEFGNPISSGDRRPLISENKVDRRETIQNYSSLEPRVSLNVLLGNTSSLKASYNRMTQYIHPVSYTHLTLPTKA